MVQNLFPSISNKHWYFKKYLTDGQQKSESHPHSQQKKKNNIWCPDKDCNGSSNIRPLFNIYLFDTNYVLGIILSA